MGWRFKGVLVLVAFALIGAGVWWLGGLIFVYLALSLRKGRRRLERTIVVAQTGVAAEEARTWKDGGGPRRPRFEWRWRYLAGGVLLIAAIFAVGAGGAFSPFVLGGLGMLCFSWAPLSSRGHIPAAGYTPARESTLLRSVLLPFRWMTVLVLKLSSQESARALSVLHDDLVVVAPPSEKPVAYLVVREAAVGYRSAESRMAERLRKLAGLLANRGVYLMPLDSFEVARRFPSGMEPVKMDLGTDTVLEAVGHYPYDVLAVKPDGGHAKSLGAYLLSRPPEEADFGRALGATEQIGVAATASGTSKAFPPAPRQSFERPPLLWEVVSCLQERFRFSDPDEYTMLLNNMHLSRNVAPGVKITLANGSAEEESSGCSTVAVESLGGTQVELTRPQLRTIVRMYG
jgi:hypothetical protein